MKIMKKGFIILGFFALMMIMPYTAHADSVDLNQPFISLGADLTDSEEKTVLEYLGVSESDLSEYTVTEITNSMEHEYLDAYLDSSVIGTKALSSVLVTGKETGYGIQVTTYNISYCTVGMYQNALATAGIENADIIVAGPFSISGTAALVGVIKSYENMTGEKIEDESVEAATNELVVTSDLADNIGDSDTAEELVGFVKDEVSSSDKDLSEDDISDMIDQAETEFDISLSDEDKQNLLVLMDQIQGLDLDVDSLKEQVENLYDRLGDKDIDLNSEETQNFFSNLVDRFMDFLNNLFGRSGENSQDSSANSSEDSSANSSADLSADSSQDSSTDSSQNSSQDSSMDSSQNSSQDSSADSSQNSSGDSSQNSSVDSSRDSSQE